MEIRVYLLFGLLHLAQSKLWDLSCEQIKVLVDGHNERRLMVANGEVPNQPPAVEMNSIVWDDDLAAQARELASTYPLPSTAWNGENPKSPSSVTSIISNMPVADRSYSYDIHDLLDGWFDNYKEYSYGPWDNDYQAGFYTQMVWSDSIHLGCAVAEEEIDVGKTFYFVCNYGPGGNVPGEFPYKALLYRSVRGSGKLECGAADCSHPYGTQCWED